MTRKAFRFALAALGAVVLLAGVLYGLQHSDLVQAERATLPSRPVAKSREASSRAHLAPSLALSKANVTATVSLHPPTDPLEVGQTFTVPVCISDLDTPLAAFQLDLSYDPTIIRFVGMEAGDGLRATGRSVVCPPHAQLTGGVRLACATTGDAPGVTAPGDLTVLTFVGLTDGQTDLTLSGIKLPTDARPPVLISDVTAQDATVIVGAACTAPDLSITKAVDPATANPGDPITYTITFSNTGNGVATNVVITDIVPVSVTNTSVISSGVTITQVGGTRYVWNVQDLTGGQGGVITITGQLSATLAVGTTFTNTATITTTAVDANPGNNSSEAGVTVIAGGTIVIEKETDPAGGTGFEFTNDIPGGPTPFTLNDGQSQTFNNVDAGSYTVTETDPTVTPGGYTLTNLNCVESGTDNSFGTVGTRTATINLEAGETVTCTFTNTLSVETATGTGTATFESDKGTIEDLAAVAEGTLPAEGKPDLDFPHGFFSFNVTGLLVCQNTTVVVTITLPSAVPVGTEYWKYHASEGGWIQIPMGSNDGDNVITITLVDGGLGDDDGVCDGVIVDQGGPGQPPAPPVPVGGIVVPVNKLGLLAPWMGLAALASLAALTVALVRRRRA